MNKETFLALLEEAQEDEYGNLYVLSQYNRVYFGTITTVCEDILNMADRKGHEVYDRHFWNDDTLECKIVTTRNIEPTEQDDKLVPPKRIEKIKLKNEIINKINEIIDVLNKYEYLLETEKIKNHDLEEEDEK